MNPWQMAQQIKHLLQAVTWQQGASAVVFGQRGVVVYAGSPPSDNAVPPGFPCALVTIGAGTPDRDHPDILSQRFGLAVIAEVAGDPFGEFAVLGGARTDLGVSAGAGVAEVSERARAAVQALTGADGAHIIVSSVGTSAPRTFGQDGRHVAIEEFELEAWCTAQPEYSAPQEVVVSGSTWTWEGAHCSDRFDFLQYRLGFVTGSTPASSPADCDGFVYTGTAATATHAPVSGRAYSVFADYDPRSTGSIANSSDGSVVGAFRVV